jgi:hypothetical protein
MMTTVDIREWAAQLKDIAPELTAASALTIAERIDALVHPPGFPMDTAPKDGTPIQVYCPMQGYTPENSVYAVVWWQGEWYIRGGMGKNSPL